MISWTVIHFDKIIEMLVAHFLPSSTKFPLWTNHDSWRRKTRITGFGSSHFNYVSLHVLLDTGHSKYSKENYKKGNCGERFQNNCKVHDGDSKQDQVLQLTVGFKSIRPTIGNKHSLGQQCTWQLEQTRPD